MKLKLEICNCENRKKVKYPMSICKKTNLQQINSTYNKHQVAVKFIKTNK